ncbi:LOW QUALITY PROTEIN: protein Bop [Rhynchonycteris naso]
MPRGRCQRQRPRHPIQVAVNYANAQPWQEIDWASSEAAYAPLVDRWIEQTCCGDPVCVRTTMEQKSTVSSEATERDPPAMRMPGSRPLRVNFHWVLGSGPDFDGSPWMLDQFLSQLSDYMSFRFEHYQEHLSHVCEILGHLTGRTWEWDPYLNRDLPLPDDYELFCHLEVVIQDPNSFAEFHAAMPFPLPSASSQPPVAPQLPVVRQYLARFSETLALNMEDTPSPAISSSNSTFRNTLPEQQLAKESNLGPTEPPALSSSECSPNPGLVGPASSQPREVAPKHVPILSEAAKPPAQKLDPAHPGRPEPQKREEELSEAEGDQEASLGGSHRVIHVPETPGEPLLFPLHPATLDCEQGPGTCCSDPCDEVACIAKEPQSSPSGPGDSAR